MKLNKYIIIVAVSILIGTLISSCKAPKDCKGRRKTVKTAMGGWL